MHTTRKKLWLCILGAFLATLVVVVPTVVKRAAYEVYGVQRIQSAIGKQVKLRHDGNTWEGTLTHADFRLNDCWGFLDLDITIEGRGFITTGLGPNELSDLVVME